MLKAKNLKIIIKNKVIDYPDFEIEEGDFVLIYGSSGSGKTSLIKRLSLLNLEYEGSIQLNGEEIKKLDDDKRSAYLKNLICYCAQENDLIEELSVKENIELGSLSKFSKEELTQELEYLGLTGYEGKKVSQLSSGEKKRVSIIKAILSNKKIIIIDEPFNFLDENIVKKVIHRLKAINNSDKIIILSSCEVYNDTSLLSALIDINEKRYKRFKINQIEKTQIKLDFTNKINRKVLVKIITKSLSKISVFTFFCFFILLWTKAFELKTKRYHDDPNNLLYIYKEGDFITKEDKNILNTLHLNMYEFYRGEFSINNIKIKKYYFNWDLFPFKKEFVIKPDKEVCYISANIESYCNYIKSNEQCKTCYIITKRFMAEEYYLIKFKDKLNPNNLLIMNLKTEPTKLESFLNKYFKGKIKLAYTECEISYYLKYLYPKIKKLSIVFNFSFAAILLFLIYNTCYHRFFSFKILFSNGVSLREGLIFTAVNFIKILYKSLFFSILAFYFFNLIVKGFFPLKNITTIFFYYLNYSFILSFISILTIYYGLKENIRKI